MTINCSEKCMYESEGICTLTHIVNSSGLSLCNCPYFDHKDRKKKHEEKLR